MGRILDEYNHKKKEKAFLKSKKALESIGFVYGSPRHGCDDGYYRTFEIKSLEEEIEVSVILSLAKKRISVRKDKSIGGFISVDVFDFTEEILYDKDKLIAWIDQVASFYVG